MWIVLFLIIIVVVLLLVGLYFSTRILYPHTRSHEETYQIEKENGFLDGDRWESLTKEEISIGSPFGYNLYGEYLPFPGSQKTVVFAHGISYTLDGSIKYIQTFRKHGFNVLVYDHRRHGKSGGKNTTFGFYEKYDLRAVVDFALQKQGGDGPVGIHGESMGAAIALQYGAIDIRPAFIVADCAFSDLRELLEYRLRHDYHLPGGIFIPLADLFCRILSGMALSAVSPQRDVRHYQTPILLIHGQEDRYVPAEMSKRIYAAKQEGIRHLYIVPDARHADAYVHDPREYENQVEQFLTRIGLIQEIQ